jgi:hypothetical protein
MTEEKTREAVSFLERSPWKSLTRLSAQSGSSLGSVHTAMRLLKLRPYKITVKELTNPSSKFIICFYNLQFWYLHNGNANSEVFYPS